MPTFEEFQVFDVRVGRILSVEHLSNAKYTTHKLLIDFGEFGKKVSCARVINYSDQELIGKQVIAVLNFPPRQIGKNMSEVLTLGVPDDNGECVLLSPDKEVPLGGKLF